MRYQNTILLALVAVSGFASAHPTVDDQARITDITIGDLGFWAYIGEDGSQAFSNHEGGNQEAFDKFRLLCTEHLVTDYTAEPFDGPASKSDRKIKDDLEGIEAPANPAAAIPPTSPREGETAPSEPDSTGTAAPAEPAAAPAPESEPETPEVTTDAPPATAEAATPAADPDADLANEPLGQPAPCAGETCEACQ